MVLVFDFYTEAEEPSSDTKRIQLLGAADTRGSAKGGEMVQISRITRTVMPLIDSDLANRVVHRYCTITYHRRFEGAHIGPGTRGSYGVGTRAPRLPRKCAPRIG